MLFRSIVYLQISYTTKKTGKLPAHGETVWILTDIPIPAVKTAVVIEGLVAIPFFKNIIRTYLLQLIRISSGYSLLKVSDIKIQMLIRAE